MTRPVEEIARIVARFGNCFDLKDWSGLEALLAEHVEVDYSDLRGERATVSRRDYVDQRRSALADLDTHHLLSNLEIEAQGDRATCRASGSIQRRRGDRHFDSHVIYVFRLERRSPSWCICGIQQKVLWSEGDPTIHAGVRSVPGTRA